MGGGSTAVPTAVDYATRGGPSPEARRQAEGEHEPPFQWPRGVGWVNNGWPLSASTIGRVPTGCFVCTSTRCNSSWDVQAVPASGRATDPPTTTSSGVSRTSPRGSLSQAPIPMVKATTSPLLGTRYIALTIPSGALRSGIVTWGIGVIADRATATLISGCVRPATV